MGDDLKESDFDEARIEQVRTAAREVLEREGMSKSRAGIDIGIGSTFSMWMNGAYPGRNGEVALKVQRWLTARLVQAATAARLPTGPGFILTRTAKRFAEIFEHAHYAPDFGVVMGEPGLGKTSAGRAYCRSTPNAWMVTVQPVTGTPYGFLHELSDVLGVGSQDTHGYKISRLVIRKLNGLRALLLVDEAQHLTTPALDQLRAFHDAAQCGIVLMGNPSIMRALEGGKRSSDYAQLFSRVGQRINQRKPAAEDIEAILTAWEIEDAAERGLFQRAAAAETGVGVVEQAVQDSAAGGVHLPLWAVLVVVVFVPAYQVLWGSYTQIRTARRSDRGIAVVEDEQLAKRTNAVMDQMQEELSRASAVIRGYSEQIDHLRQARWTMDDALRDLRDAAIAARSMVHEMQRRFGEPETIFPPLPPPPPAG